MIRTEEEAELARREIESAFNQNFGRLRELLLGEAFAVLILPAMLELLRAALSEIENDGLPDQTRAAIRKIPLVQLNRHGLYGAQWQLKLALTDAHYNGFTQSFTAARAEPAAMVQAGDRAHGWLRTFDAWLKSVLDAAGLGSALDEFKQMLEESLIRRDDDRWLGGGGIYAP